MLYYVITQNNDVPRLIRVFETEKEANQYVKKLNEVYPDILFWVRSDEDIEENGNLF